MSEAGVRNPTGWGVAVRCVKKRGICRPAGAGCSWGDGTQRSRAGLSSGGPPGLGPRLGKTRSCQGVSGSNPVLLREFSIPMPIPIPTRDARVCRTDFEPVEVGGFEIGDDGYLGGFEALRLIRFVFRGVGFWRSDRILAVVWGNGFCRPVLAHPDTAPGGTGWRRPRRRSRAFLKAMRTSPPRCHSETGGSVEMRLTRRGAGHGHCANHGARVDLPTQTLRGNDGDRFHE